MKPWAFMTGPFLEEIMKTDCIFISICTEITDLWAFSEAKPHCSSTEI